MGKIHNFKDFKDKRNLDIMKDMLENIVDKIKSYISIKIELIFATIDVGSLENARLYDEHADEINDIMKELCMKEVLSQSDNFVILLTKPEFIFAIDKLINDIVLSNMVNIKTLLDNRSNT